MAPIRRYLRISKHSVLECRIYLDDPADSRWLLDNSRGDSDPVLQRVFHSIRPLVLPKIREENERARVKKKSKPVKDVIVEDDFEVSIFLRESGTRHSLVTRQKSFFKEQGKIISNSNKLTGADSETHVLVESDEEEAPTDLLSIPTAAPEGEDSETTTQSPRRRRRPRRGRSDANDTSENDRATKRKRIEEEPRSPQEATQEDKKLGLSTSYDGYSIWGWILCLLITRKGDKTRGAKAAASTTTGATAAETTAPQTLMEEWISTQAPQEFEEG
ncbi:hypothetical protein AJ80_00315 [Polytolypa hystricis UAMH7299]|uniref:Uncharacterized protein n=1 Tax=Polytolypa hystricis (strain UAMH7299) TaxID=1447883 RepID=A0A2B7Z490_POLH7|nr:hypothetical protein AJ80_00315 [Polytolypa hystricis UAMH7299]